MTASFPSSLGYPVDGDPKCSLTRSWAFIEVSWLKCSSFDSYHAILCQQFSVKPVKYNSSVLFWNIDKEFILYYCALVRMPRPWNRPMHWKWGQCTGDGANALEMGCTHWKWEPILWRWGPCTGDGAKALAVMPLHRRWVHCTVNDAIALEIVPMHYRSCCLLHSICWCHILLDDGDTFVWMYLSQCWGF